MTTDAGDKRRISDLESRVAALEAARSSTHTPVLPGGETTGTDPFWVLNELKRILPPPGGVIYAGAVETPAGPVEWQYGALAEELFTHDWADFAKGLAAIGNPIRLSLLQAIMNGTHTVAALAELATFGTSGQIYHHINTLVAAGWLEARARGRYTIPVGRIVPLLVILTAAGRNG
jgi:hypothetical protein